ncbi:hypothetical protein [Caproicibacter fermentans]|uniref:Helix-turn-helix domain-containing protein n=1 Tax=Caproicibacter fermentans TaxID=2576756 RepID=A0A7G8T8A3_9FIRM|nr:hypothetical protein [Caproicibacter fermentans]QNK39844.1 hypothetical protein HCR03_14125 [Caproicibacter fermentans]
MNKEYARLRAEYPSVVTLDQVYRICHISKRKGRWMLENGVIPCIDTGRKTHRFQVKMADIIDFWNGGRMAALPCRAVSSQTAGRTGKKRHPW